VSVLRTGVLAGTAAALIGADAGLRDALDRLGARVVAAGEPPPAEEENVGEWAAAHGPLDAVVFAAAAAFGAGGAPGLADALDGAWASARELGRHLIDGGRAGKLILLAPDAGAGPLAAALAAGLENLARTLSVEWARFGITACAVVPGSATREDEVAEVVAYLLSPAGDYFTGCALRLGQVAVR
jgi:NAD(P)-dependent dehydrogenase (short-subunit alcohol dehydrogenase family)